MEVAIAEARNLREEAQPQPRLEAPARRQQPRRQRKLERRSSSAVKTSERQTRPAAARGRPRSRPMSTGCERAAPRPRPRRRPARMAAKNTGSETRRIGAQQSSELACRAGGASCSVPRRPSLSGASASRAPPGRGAVPRKRTSTAPRHRELFAAIVGRRRPAAPTSSVPESASGALARRGSAAVEPLEDGARLRAAREPARVDERPGPSGWRHRASRAPRQAGSAAARRRRAVPRRARRRAPRSRSVIAPGTPRSPPTPASPPPATVMRWRYSSPAAARTRIQRRPPPGPSPGRAARGGARRRRNASGRSASRTTTIAGSAAASGEQQVIGGNDDLLGVEPELVGDRLPSCRSTCRRRRSGRPRAGGRS